MTNTANEFRVTVRNPDKTVWQGMATAVSSENSTGAFDILAEHANFVTMLKKTARTTIRKSDNSNEQIVCGESVLAVQNGEVKIYTDI